MRRIFAGLIALVLVAAFQLASAQQVDPSMLNGLRWRLIGPFRGGRSLAVTGVPGNNEKFYMGAVGGGVWVTENAGRTWKPIFDKVPVASIGAIAVAPSDPKTIYVGSGEADMRSDIQQGKGIYKSTDEGKTWNFAGLPDSRQIGKIIIDPADPNRVFVAALGHQYGPNAERGVYRSLDGGQTWEKVLGKDDNTGAIDLAMDPSDPQTIFASLWQTRRPPWSIYPPSNGPGSGLYKSTDGGQTWKQLTSGFPAKVGRIGISISPANPKRVYTCVDGLNPKEGGVYRSDDGGETWALVGKDKRIWGRGWYFMGITADPKDPDTVYVMNTSSYRSTDGGQTWTAFKGAPGGDDYHTLWINPQDNHYMILGSDQGTVVSVDGGSSWSSWYNQPTGQFYHIVTDKRDPYWVYGSQQDSGAMAVPSRTIHTGVSALYQRPIDAGGESGTLVTDDDKNDPKMYSSTGIVEDFDSGQSRSIEPTLRYPGTNWRSEWTQPIVRGPQPGVLFTSHQNIFKSTDNGSSWRLFSPDLTRTKLTVPPNLDPTTAADRDPGQRQGVVYWIAPSPVDKSVVWAGTDDGLIWLTRDDGKHWKNVTPSQMIPWSKVGIIEAGSSVTGTAYAAIDRHRVDDNHPYIYRTHDFGKHWSLIVNGLPKDQFVNVVREDAHREGLVYAGTDWGVYVSFDFGDHWQSLQLNLPACSVRDIVFAENDVIICTHGRANWVLDDVSPLRDFMTRTMVSGQSGNSPAKDSLFNPEEHTAFLRAGTFGFGLFDEGTPLPPEEPQGENKPAGLPIDYYLGKPAKTVVVKILDQGGQLIRKMSSNDSTSMPDPNTLDIPAYWIKPSPRIETKAGAHRTYWDYRAEFTGNPLMPGDWYQIELDVDGVPYHDSVWMHWSRSTWPKANTEAPNTYRTARAIGLLVDQLAKVRGEITGYLKSHGDGDVSTRLRQIAGGDVLRRRRGPAPASNANDLASIETQLRGVLSAITAVPGPVRKDERLLARELKAKASSLVQRAEKLMSPPIPRKVVR